MALIEKTKQFFSKKRTTEKRGNGRSDLFLLLLILILSTFGSLMVFSASYAYAERRYGDSFYFIKRQILWLFVGLVAMFLTSLITFSGKLERTLPLA